MSLAVYGEPLRQIIHLMKYSGRWSLAEMLGDRLCRMMARAGLADVATCVVPVPLHWKRRLVRGYNQSEIIAARVAAGLGLPLVRALRRIRDTPRQTGLTSQQARQENVRGAFALSRSSSLQGRRVLVVDDVTTSGATLQAVGRAILPARPASLTAAVLAMADPRGRDFQSL